MMIMTITFVFIFAITFAITVFVGILQYREETRLMNLALAEPDPVVRQLKIDKAIAYKKANTYCERMDLRKAIES